MAMPEIGSSRALPANRGSGGPNQIMREATFKVAFTRCSSKPAEGALLHG